MCRSRTLTFIGVGRSFWIKKGYEKIVVNGRGGFCYELNGLFINLLLELGFLTRLVSARVFGVERGFGPEFDHAAIIVSFGEADYLVDVGFGDFSAEPLKIADGIEQADREGTFRISSADNDSFMVEKKNGHERSNAYLFGCSHVTSQSLPRCATFSNFLRTRILPKESCVR